MVRLFFFILALFFCVYDSFDTTEPNCDCDDQMARGRRDASKTDLVFFQKTPFLTFERLGALFVIAPLDCVAHGRHDCFDFG